MEVAKYVYFSRSEKNEFLAPAPQFGLQRATIVSASLCEAADRARGSVAFTFAHQETGRNMHGALATGLVRKLPAGARRAH